MLEKAVQTMPFNYSRSQLRPKQNNDEACAGNFSGEKLQWKVQTKVMRWTRIYSTSPAIYQVFLLLLKLNIELWIELLINFERLMQGTNFNTKIQLQPKVSLAGLTGPPISEFLARRVFFPESGTYLLLRICYIFLCYLIRTHWYYATKSL